MKNQIKKISTIYRKEREKSPTIFESLRSEFISAIVNSKPNFSPRVIISQKPF